MVQAAFTHVASEIAAVVVGVLAAGGAMMATTRGYIRRTVESMLDTKVHDEVETQMRPIETKIDDLFEAQERSETRLEGSLDKFDGRLRTIESNSSEVLGIVKGLHANQ